jgi:hypothetical protein
MGNQAEIMEDEGLPRLLVPRPRFTKGLLLLFCREGRGEVVGGVQTEDEVEELEDGGKQEHGEPPWDFKLGFIVPINPIMNNE